jgi:hypothetical protein
MALLPHRGGLLYRDKPVLGQTPSLRRSGPIRRGKELSFALREAETKHGSMRSRRLTEGGLKYLMQAERLPCAWIKGPETTAGNDEGSRDGRSVSLPW